VTGGIRRAGSLVTQYPATGFGFKPAGQRQAHDGVAIKRCGNVAVNIRSTDDDDQRLLVATGYCRFRPSTAIRVLRPSGSNAAVAAVGVSEWATPGRPESTVTIEAGNGWFAQHPDMLRMKRLAAPS
jgi:hypothetical protein